MCIDEGWFEVENPPTYPYAPGVGVNFTDNISIDTIDFGTFHAYPEVYFLPNKVLSHDTD